MRTGTTLIEVGVAVAILGIMAGMTFPSLRHRIGTASRSRPRPASTLSLLATARHAALRRARRPPFTWIPPAPSCSSSQASTRLERRPLHEVHGVGVHDHARLDRICAERTRIRSGQHTDHPHGAAPPQTPSPVSRLGRARRYDVHAAVRSRVTEPAAQAIRCPEIESRHRDAGRSAGRCTRSIMRTIAISSGDMNVNASPVCAARPVRPMRCT